MKRIYTITFIFIILSLLIVPEKVNAQQGEEFPERFVKLSYVEHEFVQENEEVYEYRAVYSLPYTIRSNVIKYWYYLYFDYYVGFNRQQTGSSNSYFLTSVQRYSDYTILQFRVILRKDFVNTWYPDGNLLKFFVEDSDLGGAQFRVVFPLN